MTDEKETNGEQNRRYGIARRVYNYANHIPERRNGSDRRTADDNESAIPEHASQDSSTNSSPQASSSNNPGKPAKNKPNPQSGRGFNPASGAHVEQPENG